MERLALYVQSKTSYDRKLCLTAIVMVWRFGIGRHWFGFDVPVHLEITSLKSHLNNKNISTPLELYQIQI